MFWAQTRDADSPSSASTRGAERGERRRRSPTSTGRRGSSGSSSSRRSQYGVRLRARLVHLPVAGDVRPARRVGQASSSASTPGSALPSSSSSAAPPPVERWSTRSASPNCGERRAGVAAADDRRARRLAPRPRRPRACRPRTAPARTRPSGRSRRPCRAFAISCGVRARPSAGRCRGPSSRPGTAAPSSYATSASRVEAVADHEVDRQQQPAARLLGLLERAARPARRPRPRPASRRSGCPARGRT